MQTVSDILRFKKTESLCSVQPQATVFEALQVMAEKNIGAVLVLDCGKLVGIFSERDYARKVVLKDRSSKTTQVQELMTSKFFWVLPSDSLEKCMLVMSEKHIRHLPVLEQDELRGIISIGDVVNAVISRQKKTIHDMENYICGSYGADINT